MKRPSKEQLAEDIQTNMLWKDIAAKYGYTDARFLRKLRVRYGLPQRREYLKPSREELYRMINEGLTPYAIADKLGYTKGGWSNIYAYCRQYGIEFDFRPNAHLYNRPFTEKQKSLIWGSVLGDGTLTSSCNGNNVYFRITHGHKQLSYLKWKHELLSPYVLSEVSEREAINPVGDKTRIYSFSTITHPWLVSIFQLCYPDKVKTVSLEWLKEVDELALAIWFMDDGSLNKRYGTMVFCTNSFDYQQHLIMQGWFNDRWGIPTKIEPRRNNTYAMRVNASVAVKLREIISPHVPSFMRHKVDYLR